MPGALPDIPDRTSRADRTASRVRRATLTDGEHGSNTAVERVGDAGGFVEDEEIDAAEACGSSPSAMARHRTRERSPARGAIGCVDEGRGRPRASSASRTLRNISADCRCGRRQEQDERAGRGTGPCAGEGADDGGLADCASSRATPGARFRAGTPLPGVRGHAPRENTRAGSRADRE